MLPKINQRRYLSEGVSVRFDGYQLLLSSDHFARDDEVSLTPDGVQKLIEWINEHDKLRQYMYGVNE